MKLFVVYSPKLVKDFSNLALEAYYNGFQFLSLDIEAAVALKRLSIPTLFVEDFLSIDERVNIYQKTLQKGPEQLKEIYSNIESNLLQDFQSDYLMFSSFLFEHFLQIDLENAFVRNGVKALKLVKFKGFGPSKHESESDTFGNLWLNSNNFKVECIICKKQTALVRNFFNSIKLLANKFYEYSQDRLQESQKNIFIYCSKEEYFYFKENIKKMQDKFGYERVIVSIHNVSFFELSEIAANDKFRKYFIPWIEKENNSFLDNESIKKNKLYKSYDHHFKYYENIKWPSNNYFKKRIEYHFKKINPGCVIVSSIEDFKNIALCDLANKNNILSISFPHGALGTSKLGISNSLNYAVGNKLARSLAIGTNINKNNISIFSGLDPVHEYEMSKKVHLQKSKNVLVLTNPIKASEDTRVAYDPSLGYKEQISAINDLKDIENNGVGLFIKTHPGWPETEIFSFTDPKFKKNICPPDTSLTDLLSSVDLVIGLNYFGAAIMAVNKAKVPLILYYKSPIIKLFKTCFSPDALSIFESGEVIDNKKELDLFVDKMLFDKSFRAKTISRQNDFYDKYIYEKNPQNLEDYIDKNI